MATPRKTTKERLAETRQKLAEKSPAYKQLLDRKAEKKQFFDEKISEIKSLTSEGKNRAAYRVFEELPALDQITILLTPGLGDAIAAFEVGEFKTRADERFAQDDTLGGLGNLLLSGLSGASLLPVVGSVAGAAGKAAKGLTRVSRIEDPSMAGGPSGGYVPNIPNEYIATRPAEKTKGLISPTRKALADLINEGMGPRKLDVLVAELRKRVPGKEGEFRALGLFDEDDRITKQARNYFSGIEKITPEALDQYLGLNQKDVLKVVKPARSEYESPGLEEINPDTEVQRIFEVKDINNTLSRKNHFFDYPRAIAFDSTYQDAGRLYLARVQSDVDGMLQDLSKRELPEGAKSNDVFKLPEKSIEPPKISDETKRKVAEELEDFNKSVLKINAAEGNRFKGIFGADSDVPKVDRRKPKKIKDPQDFDFMNTRGEELRKQRNIAKGVRQLVADDVLSSPQELGDDLERLISDGSIFKYDYDTKHIGDDAAKIFEREKAYNYDDLIEQIDMEGHAEFGLDPNYYGLDKRTFIRLYPNIKVKETLNNIQEAIDRSFSETRKSNIRYNINRPKKTLTLQLNLVKLNLIFFLQEI